MKIDYTVFLSFYIVFLTLVDFKPRAQLSYLCTTSKVTCGIKSTHSCAQWVGRKRALCWRDVPFQREKCCAVTFWWLEHGKKVCLWKKGSYHEKQDISGECVEWQVRRNEGSLKQLKTICVVVMSKKKSGGREGRMKTSELLHSYHRKFFIS